jgi:hypothetical protein
MDKKLKNPPSTPPSKPERKNPARFSSAAWNFTICHHFQLGLVAYPHCKGGANIMMFVNKPTAVVIS